MNQDIAPVGTHPHDWEPGEPDRMNADPLCRICGERKHHPIHH